MRLSDSDVRNIEPKKVGWGGCYHLKEGKTEDTIRERIVQKRRYGHGKKSIRV